MDEKPPSSGKHLKTGTFQEWKFEENAKKFHKLLVFYPKLYNRFHRPGGGSNLDKG